MWPFRAHPATGRKAYRPGKDGYVSEFTLFINSHLRLHPEVIVDQHLGWAKYWEPRIDSANLQQAPQDVAVEDDHLGTISKDD